MILVKALFALPLFILALEVVLQLNQALIAWTTFVVLLLVGAEFFTIMLGLRKQPLANGWYRLASWAGWIVCCRAGALLIGATVLWGITGPTQGPFPPVSMALVITVLVLGLVGMLVIVGLLVAGAVSQHRQKIRQQSAGVEQSGNGESAGVAPADA